MAAKVNREANLRGGLGGLRGGCGRQRSFLGTRRAWSASLTAPSGAGNLAWYPARLRRRPQPPRGLGNLQTTCLSLSDPSETFKQPVWAFPTPRKPSNNLFEPFRPLGNLQTTCLGLSDPSERLRGGCGRRRSIPGTRQAWPASLTPRKGGKHAPQGVPRPSRLSLPPVIWYMDAWRAIRYHV